MNAPVVSRAVSHSVQIEVIITHMSRGRSGSEGRGIFLTQTLFGAIL